MSASCWLPAAELQPLPGEPAVGWYVAAFLFALLVAAVAVGIRAIRSEEPRVDSETLINAVEEPLAVLGTDDTVLLANEPFRRVFGADGGEEQIEDVLDPYPQLKAAISDREEDVVAVEKDGETRQYEVRMYHAGKGPSSSRERVVLLHDVTDHHEKQARLEAEKEQLDRFASLVSHDLRNPLDVAIGRTNAVKEMLDDPELERHLSRTQDSHERMQQIITDLLALARDGHSIGQLQCVPLETAAIDAWSQVETESAEMVVRTQLVIEADREQLTRVFENLFRNAIQHGGDGVRVEIGTLENGTGFFISDDGEGIDPDEREAVLEAGYTGGKSGTGLGLAIVTSIAEAHGWDVAVTASPEGGARFEFSGVEQIRDEFTVRQVGET